jgi:hypothetical protein
MTVPQIEKIDTSVLIEMLARNTERFTNLFRLHSGISPNEEYLSCKETIDALINEIDKRDISSKARAKYFHRITI